jgi:hypothetical protein
MRNLNSNRTIICGLTVAILTFAIMNDNIWAVNVTLTARTTDTIIADPTTADLSEDVVTVARDTGASFKLLGEYNGKPPVSEEMKPGSAEWKFSDVICVPSDGVTRSVPDPKTWTRGETISGTATARSSKVGLFRLTYTAQVRFPKLKRDGSQIKDSSGNPTYFGPYPTSVTVTLNVTDAKFKVWIESADDNFSGHSLFKLGLQEKGIIKVEKIKPTDPSLYFKRAEIIDDVGQIQPTLSGQYLTAGKKSGTVTINVWAAGTAAGFLDEHGPETFKVTIVKPSGVGMVRDANYSKIWHIQGKASAGMMGVYYLLPSDVSFFSLQYTEGGDSVNDGKAEISGFFEKDYNDMKKQCEPYWKVLNDTTNSYSQQEKDAAELELKGLEAGSHLHCVEESKFYYHKEIGDPIGIDKGIPSRSNKPNTSRAGTNDIIRAGFAKNLYGITTASGFIDGTLNWNISQTYWIGEATDANKVSDFSAIDQNSTIDNSGRMSVNKGNASGSAALNDPSSGF